MAEGSKTVAFRLNKGKHEEWSEYAEENPEYDSLSHLIRRAVAREIAAEGQPRGGNPEGSANEQHMGELIQSVEKMAHRLNKLEPAVKDATMAMHEANTDSDISSEVYDALPEGEHSSVTATMLAEEIDAKPQRVAVALARLEHNTGVVERVETAEKEHPEAAPQAGETYWYKAEGA